MWDVAAGGLIAASVPCAAARAPSLRRTDAETAEQWTATQKNAAKVNPAKSVVFAYCSETTRSVQTKPQRSLAGLAIVDMAKHGVTDYTFAYSNG